MIKVSKYVEMTEELYNNNKDMNRDFAIIAATKSFMSARQNIENFFKKQSNKSTQDLCEIISNSLKSCIIHCYIANLEIKKIAEDELSSFIDNYLSKEDEEKLIGLDIDNLDDLYAYFHNLYVDEFNKNTISIPNEDELDACFNFLKPRKIEIKK